jgi:hydrogenase maturation protease
MTPTGERRVLVACVGNIFKSDDGFGVEVATVLGRTSLPPRVRVVDYGIRAVHLVYDLLDGYDLLVLVDAVSRDDGPPGTVVVIEPELPDRTPHEDLLPEAMLDPHDLSPAGAMELVPILGGHVGRIVVVGVIPASVEDGMGTSPEVAAAVEPAARAVLDVVSRELATT